MHLIANRICAANRICVVVCMCCVVCALYKSQKYKFLSLKGSKFIQQIATNTTNSATLFPLVYPAKWPKNA